jgi:hypothetical protein
MPAHTIPKVGAIVIFSQGGNHAGGFRSVPALVHEASGSLVTLSAFPVQGGVVVEQRVPHRDEAKMQDAYWRWPDEEPPT